MGPRNEQTVPLRNSPGAWCRLLLASNPGVAMPRYFFNIHDGDHFTPDHVGMELEGNRSKEGRIQTVVATRVLLTSRNHSSSASAGVFQPSVFLGLALRAAATAAISSALCALKSVPFGKY
jgi:hypothetical protein